jgi:ribosome-associated protein
MSGEPLRVNDRIVVPAADLDYEYARSSGPGGQHVQTTDTAVRLRFALDRTTAIGPGVKERIRRARPGDVTQDGELLITSERHRSKAMNVDDVRQKLVDLIVANLKPPKPRVKTKPTRASQERRKDAKARRGAVKQGRGKVRDD